MNILQEPTTRITVDATPVLADVKEMELLPAATEGSVDFPLNISSRFLEILNALVDLLGDGDVACVEGQAAMRAGDLVVGFHVSDRFRELLAAMRSLELDRL
jgi:hypothetical protein